jgi:hypothetical protein
LSALKSPSLLKTKWYIKVIFQYWTVYTRLADTVDVSANKAFCLLLARANAQDTFQALSAQNGSGSGHTYERADHAQFSWGNTKTGAIH